jgi:hypothetical protein
MGTKSVGRRVRCVDEYETMIQNHIKGTRRRWMDEVAGVGKSDAS